MEFSLFILIFVVDKADRKIKTKEHKRIAAYSEWMREEMPYQSKHKKMDKRGNGRAERLVVAKESGERNRL